MIASRRTGLGAGEVQLDHHIVIVGKKQLIDWRRCDVVFAVLDLFLFEASLYAIEVGCQERKMIEWAGVVRRPAFGGTPFRCRGSLIEEPDGVFGGFNIIGISPPRV